MGEQQQMKNSIFKNHHTYSGDRYDLTLTSILKAKIEILKEGGSNLNLLTAQALRSKLEEFHYYLSKLGLKTAKDMIAESTTLKPILDYITLYRNDQSYRMDFVESNS